MSKNKQTSTIFSILNLKTINCFIAWGAIILTQIDSLNKYFGIIMLIAIISTVYGFKLSYFKKFNYNQKSINNKKNERNTNNKKNLIINSSLWLSVLAICILMISNPKSFDINNLKQTKEFTTKEERGSTTRSISKKNTNYDCSSCSNTIFEEKESPEFEFETLKSEHKSCCKNFPRRKFNF
ncbi:MAG: hypothetical protein N4A49_02395 [Marinifilaceae bacterium]|jgi:hypothetical protein|nr:hypothetical protein [Marinifilaceae bacterium]